MAKLFISEYMRMPADVRGLVQTGEEPSLATQTVAIGASSAQSVAFNAATKFVRINTDAVCSLKFGTNPTATVNDLRLATNATEFFGVTPGHKVAVIANT